MVGIASDNFSFVDDTVAIAGVGFGEYVARHLFKSMLPRKEVDIFQLATVRVNLKIRTSVFMKSNMCTIGAAPFKTSNSDP